MRKEYTEKGVEGYYVDHGRSYRNPHFEAIVKVVSSLLDRWGDTVGLGCDGPWPVLDMACGSGEASLALCKWAHKRNLKLQIDGTDPFTGEAYFERIGKEALQFSFDDIADGCFADRKFNLCICSFALHLLDVTKLYATCVQLAQVCKYLIIVTPHKRPTILPNTGWNLLDEIIGERLRTRIYQSNFIGFE